MMFSLCVLLDILPVVGMCASCFVCRWWPLSWWWWQYRDACCIDTSYLASLLLQWHSLVLFPLLRLLSDTHFFLQSHYSNFHYPYPFLQSLHSSFVYESLSDSGIVVLASLFSVRSFSPDSDISKQWCGADGVFPFASARVSSQPPLSALV